MLALQLSIITEILLTEIYRKDLCTMSILVKLKKENFWACTMKRKNLYYYLIAYH